jgi:hypothetical protein
MEAAKGEMEKRENELRLQKDKEGKNKTRRIRLA